MPPFRALLLALALATAACTTATPDRGSPPASPTAPPSAASDCDADDGSPVADLLLLRAREWEDAVRVAAATPREEIEPVLVDLQRLRRSLEAEPLPACATQARRLLVQSMSSTIDGYGSFLAERSSYQINLDQGLLALVEFGDELARLAGDPTVHPWRQRVEGDTAAGVVAAATVTQYVSMLPVAQRPDLHRAAAESTFGLVLLPNGIEVVAGAQTTAAPAGPLVRVVPLAGPHRGQGGWVSAASLR